MTAEAFGGGVPTPTVTHVSAVTPDARIPGAGRRHEQPTRLLRLLQAACLGAAYAGLLDLPRLLG